MMTDEERYLFDLQGFLVAPDALTPEQLSALNATMDEHIARDTAPDMRTHRFGPVVGWNRAYQGLIDNPRITPYLSALLGDRFRLDHDYADVIRSGKGPIGTTLHGGGAPFDPSQYYVYRDGRMHNGLLVVAYYLKDVNPGDGGFAGVPGSHKANLPFPNGWRDLETLHPCVRPVPGPAGTAVLFTEALTHGTLPWKGADERRTVFLKYCPHPLAWSRGYYKEEDFEDLNDAQRRILHTPGVYPRE